MKVSLTFLALLFSTCSFTQDLTGTWEGVFGTRNIIPGRNSLFMHLEIKQDGRKLAGIFYLLSPETRQIDMVYEISGELGRKNIFPFRLITGALLDRDHPFTDFIFSGFENIRYLKDDTAQILYGRWQCYRISMVEPAVSGFAVKKINNTYSFVEKYYKKN
jgi:hypothetical protein